MTNPANSLSPLLSLKEIAPNIFEAPSVNPGWNRVYGGQVIAQAILAANQTAQEGKTCHSCHCYFLRPGNPDAPINYKVNNVREGRSFQTQSVEASQAGTLIFTMSASFHKTEPGPEHQTEMGDIPDPDDLPTITELLEKHETNLPKAAKNYFTRERPFELRPLNINRYLDPKPSKPAQAFWLKATPAFENNPVIHQAALGYASDFTLLDTALIAHGKLIFDPSLMLASLDHSLWFHRPLNVNEWILYKQTSSNAFGARALCHGQFFTRHGTLIASAAQEGLTRPVRRPA